MPKGTYKQIEFKTKEQWLDSRGGRNDDDLYKDKKGYFVMMSNGGGREVRVYLPKYLQDKVR